MPPLSPPGPSHGLPAAAADQARGRERGPRGKGGDTEEPEKGTGREPGRRRAVALGRSRPPLPRPRPHSLVLERGSGARGAGGRRRRETAPTGSAPGFPGFPPMGARRDHWWTLKAPRERVGPLPWGPGRSSTPTGTSAKGNLGPLPQGPAAGVTAEAPLGNHRWPSIHTRVVRVCPPGIRTRVLKNQRCVQLKSAFPQCTSWIGGGAVHSTFAKRYTGPMKIPKFV